MNASDARETDVPARIIDTDGVAVELSGAPLEYSSTTPGRVRADEHLGHVSFMLTQHDGDDWPVSACAYLKPTEARDVAALIRDDSHGAWTVGDGTAHLDIGRVYYNPPALNDDADCVAMVTVAPRNGKSRVAVAYRDGDGLIQLNTTLDDDEAATLADALDAAADRADEYEPRTPSNVQRQSESRLGRPAASLIPGVVVLGIASLVAFPVMNAVSGSMTVNGEPVGAPSPWFVLFIFGFAVFLLWAIQYLPGAARGVGR